MYNLYIFEESEKKSNVSLPNNPNIGNMSRSFSRQSTTPSANHSNESARLASASTANSVSLNISESDAYYNNASDNSYTNVSTSSATSRQQIKFS